MTSRIQPGDRVYVPSTRVGLTNATSALKEVEVVSVQDRSVTVNLANGATATIGSKLVHRNVALLIVRIGDFATESSLLNPLAKSLLQFCRILLPDDQVRLEQLRTQEEFCLIWNRDHRLYSHVVLIAHGDGDTMTFGSEQLTPKDLADCFAGTNSQAKSFISLCCHSGKASFAKPFSQETPCHTFIAPFRECHGATASQFCQTLLAHHFLEGMTLRSAFKNSQNAPGGTSFRYWKNGQMI